MADSEAVSDTDAETPAASLASVGTIAQAAADRAGTALWVSNTCGAGLAMLLGWLVVPEARAPTGTTALLLNGGLLVAFLLQATFVGLWWIRRRVKDGWCKVASSSADAQRDAQRKLLRTPLAATCFVGLQWIGGVLLIGAANLSYSSRFLLVVAVTGLFTGLAMCGLAYLLVERFLRPLAAHTLAAAPIGKPTLFGVAWRQLLGWMLGTGSAVAGLLLIALYDIASPGASRRELTLAILVFCLLALVGGLVIEFLTARAVADPVLRLREGLAAVERGDLSTRMRVDDATDLGLVQDGFNRMVSGLRERERTRRALNRLVGDDIARHALTRHGQDLGGATCDVSVLFVDIVGSTELASRSDPADVVEVLNRFFDVVVTLISRHGGSVNKFEGDAALAIFGAPDPLPERHTRALLAARALADTLMARVPEVDIGIGVSSGTVVAGNIGAPERHEYTVIGDPVNEAARLCDTAKTLVGRIAAAGHLVEHADLDESRHWYHHSSRTLRGRSQQTRIMSVKQ